MKKIFFFLLISNCSVNFNLLAQVNYGLIAYFPFNGNANDVSGNGNDGNVLGPSLTTDRFGNNNRAYSFDGIDDRISIQSNSIFESSEVTFSCWISPTAINNSFNCIIKKGNWANASNESYGFGLAGPNDLLGGIKNNSCSAGVGWQNGYATVPNILNSWHHLIYSYANDTLKYFFDGALVLSNFIPGEIIYCPGGEINIGCEWSQYLLPFKGKLDDIRIYNRALNSSEITELYNEVGYIKLFVLPQGYYNSLANRLYRKEKMKLFLRESFSPYEIVDTSSSIIDSISFSGVFDLYNASNGFYYLEVKHKNCIETWSSTPFNFQRDSTAEYNYTNSKSKAYGDNMIQVDMSPVRFGMFSGDINDDGTIDIGDLIAIYNDAINLVEGDVITDITGDRFVDNSDLLMCYNNVINVISVISPSKRMPSK